MAQTSRHPEVQGAGRPLTQFMTAQELADYLRVSLTTVYRMANRKQLPGFRVGSEWRFSIEEVNRWFRKRRREI